MNCEAIPDANCIHHETEYVWLAYCADRSSSRPMPPGDDSRPPARNAHPEVYFAGVRIFLSSRMLRIFVGAGCRQGLWPDSNDEGVRCIAAACNTSSGHPLPCQCWIDDLDDPRCKEGARDTGGRVELRLVFVEQN